MARGPGATLCPKCSQHSLDPKGAVCLQRDRRVLVSRGRECLFGFPSYLIALAVESERAAVGGLTPSLGAPPCFQSVESKS